MAQNYIIKAIPEPLHTFLKIEAVKQRTTLNQLIITILIAYKDKEGK